MKSEAEIKAAWEAYQSKAHPEDMMSYVEFLSEMGVKLN
jgi:hypothetical protein